MVRFSREAMAARFSRLKSKLSGGAESRIGAPAANGEGQFHERGGIAIQDPERVAGRRQLHAGGGSACPGAP